MDFCSTARTDALTPFHLPGRGMRWPCPGSSSAGAGRGCRCSVSRAARLRTGPRGTRAQLGPAPWAGVWHRGWGSGRDRALPSTGSWGPAPSLFSSRWRGNHLPVGFLGGFAALGPDERRSGSSRASRSLRRSDGIAWAGRGLQLWPPSLTRPMRCSRI